MRKQSIVYKLLFFVLGMQLLTSCSKYLDINPETGSNLSVKQYKDFEEVLNNISFTNANYDIAEMLTDNVYIWTYWLDNIATDFSYKNAYLLNEDFWTANDVDNLYTGLYANIANANLVINDLPLAIDATEEQKAKLIAIAKIHRAYFYLQLVGFYGPAYNPSTAKTDLAIPLIKNLDPNQLPSRATVEEIYQLVESDILDAINSNTLQDEGSDLLHPGKLAAMSVLSKMYLQKGEFPKAKEYAEKVLAVKNEMLNYEEAEEFDNGFPEMLLDLKNHPEIIFAKVAEDTKYLSKISGSFLLSKQLKSLFINYDLRADNFFEEGWTYDTYKTRRSASGAILRFRNSITVAEMMLIAAECGARAGQTAEPLALINKIRQNRFYEEDYEALSGTTAQEVLSAVLEERRRELAFVAGSRLLDLKRLYIADKKTIKITRWDDDGKIMKEIESNSPILTIPLTPKVLAFNPNLRTK